MGVMKCDRNGCENIMCSRISHKFNAYICDECFDELVRSGVATEIQYFLDKQKSIYQEEEAAKAYFDVIFKKIEY